MIKVVILGGGFAGVQCAQQLSSSSVYKVTLVDRKDCFIKIYSKLLGII